MRIERVELREVFLPYVAPFETSGWREEGCHAVIVRIDAEGITAWGESPVGRHPFYNEENTRSVWMMQQDYLIPMLFEKELNGPEDVTPTFAKIRGNRMAQ
ncbi:MAG: o-succinylbenzoate synthase, partial [Caldilineaceae bacterium]|nr:o-succinylbenzoate synthase [Caldilineaceae bacterium]